MLQSESDTRMVRHPYTTSVRYGILAHCDRRSPYQRAPDISIGADEPLAVDGGLEHDKHGHFGSLT